MTLRRYLTMLGLLTGGYASAADVNCPPICPVNHKPEPAIAIGAPGELRSPEYPLDPTVLQCCDTPQKLPQQWAADLQITAPGATDRDTYTPRHYEAVWDPQQQKYVCVVRTDPETTVDDTAYTRWEWVNPIDLKTPGIYMTCSPDFGPPAMGVSATC